MSALAPPITASAVKTFSFEYLCKLKSCNVDITEDDLELDNVFGHKSWIVFGNQSCIVRPFPKNLLTVDPDLVERIVKEAGNMEATDCTRETRTEIYLTMVFPQLSLDSESQITRQYMVPALQRVGYERNSETHGCYLTPPPNGRLKAPIRGPPTTSRILKSVVSSTSKEPASVPSSRIPTLRRQRAMSMSSISNPLSMGGPASMGASLTQDETVSSWYTTTHVTPGFDFKVTLRYWISQHAFEDQTIQQAKYWIPSSHTKNKLRFYSPYLTVDFAEKGRSERESRYKLAAASLVPLYQEFLLFKLMKAERAKAAGSRVSKLARAEPGRRFLHWGILCHEVEFEIFAIIPQLDDTQDNWKSCRALSVKQGRLTSTQDVSLLLDWVNHIHLWGLGMHARNFMDDLHNLPKHDTIIPFLAYPPQGNEQAVVAGPSNVAGQAHVAGQTDGAGQTDAAGSLTGIS
ncbi:hypothetical protein MMC13_001077 [Lambiella insularis]|nr:hypothetical protein [Lambiella insularis]